jgi:hypothetical protein
MVLVDDRLFIAGPPDLVDEEYAARHWSDAEVQERVAEQAEAFRGSLGGTIWSVSTEDGRKISEWPLDTVPVFDGMIAANGRLYLSGVDGRIRCYGPPR